METRVQGEGLQTWNSKCQTINLLNLVSSLEVKTMSLSRMHEKTVSVVEQHMRACGAQLISARFLTSIPRLHLANMIPVVREGFPHAFVSHDLYSRMFIAGTKLRKRAGPTYFSLHSSRDVEGKRMHTQTTSLRPPLSTDLRCSTSVRVVL